jgi:ATP-dependent Clp protease ATP-binding subunit ClpX
MAVATRSKAADLFAATDEVIGQKHARQLLAALLDRQWMVHQGILDRSSGAILSGRSGTGKTMTARLMCQHIGLPYAEADATRYTEGGYKGLDLPQIFIPLLEEAARMKDATHAARMEGLGQPATKHTSVLKRPDIEEVVEIAQTGVILLDEMDKWMLRINHVTGQTDKSIQSELLKMIEGSIEYVSDSDEEIGIQFDTSKVLIICAGAFVGLFQQVARRQHHDSDDRDYLQQESFWNQITPEDFEKYGLLPELAGRLSRHIFTRPLRVDDLRAILRREGGLIEEYRTRFEAYGCQWAVSEAGEIRIASIAIERDTGARALEHVMSKKFDLALFEAAVSEVPVKVVLEPSMDKAEVRPQ